MHKQIYVGYFNMVKNVGLIGDSIGHGYYDEYDKGWFSRLGNLILSQQAGEYVFNNISYSGDNIADATSRANFEVLSRNFDLIFINIGINDLRRRKDSNLQLDFSEGVRVMYWNRLLDIATKTNATIIVTDLLPVVEERYTAQASLIRRNDDVKRYNEIIENICKQRNILFFKRYDKWLKRDLQNLYKDATHPKAEGLQMIAEEIYEYMKNKNLI